MQTFEQVLEEILKIKTESVDFGSYKAKLRTLTAEQVQEANKFNSFDTINEFVNYINEHGIVFEDVRLINHDDYDKTKLIQFWNYFNDDDLPEEVAKEICSLSGIDFPEAPEEDDYPEELSPDEMAAMTPVSNVAG